MLVCVCKGVSDRRIRALVKNGARHWRDVVSQCSAGSDCGTCLAQVRDLVEDECQADEGDCANLPKASGDDHR